MSKTLLVKHYGGAGGAGGAGGGGTLKFAIC